MANTTERMRMANRGWQEFLGPVQMYECCMLCRVDAVFETFAFFFRSVISWGKIMMF